MKFKQSPNQRQRYVLSRELFKSVSPEEVDKTWVDMIKMGIAKPPYQHFEIEMSSENVFASQITIPAGTPYNNFDDLVTNAAWRTNTIKGLDVLIKYDFTDDDLLAKLLAFTTSMWVGFDGNFKKFVPTTGDIYAAGTPKGIVEVKFASLPKFCDNMLILLIVLLATKNIEKKVKVDKLARLGIGKNKHRPYTTTYLNIGKVTESIDKSGKVVNPTGRQVRPHLRAGHIRNQHYGINNKYTKQIFIEPCFVNADKEWIGDRTEYRILQTKGGNNA